MHILALGSKPYNLGLQFLQFENYTLHPIDTEKRENGLLLPIYRTDEEYDENEIKGIKAWAKKIKGDILFIVEGGIIISSASLNILKHFKGHKITILYLKPNIDTLQGNAPLRERAVCSILQEYARSGVFERLFLISLSIVTGLVGNVALAKHEGAKNQIIADTFHRISVFQNTRPVFGDEVEEGGGNRIATIGYLDMLDGKEILFYNLVPEQKFFFFSVPGAELGGNVNLKNELEKRANGGSFRVYENGYEASYGFVLVLSSTVQI
jgi:hypothetical protein